MVLKMRSGVGRDVCVDAAIRVASWSLIQQDILPTQPRSHSFPSEPRLQKASILVARTAPLLAYSLPASKAKAKNETRISPLVFSPARIGARRRRLRSLGSAAGRIPHQRWR